MNDKSLEELVDKLIPLLRYDEYNYELVTELCRSCLTYLSINEATILSFILLSIFNELRIYIRDISEELDKMFGSTAQQKECERIAEYFKENFIICLEDLKGKNLKCEEMHQIIIELIFLWLNFEKEDLSKFDAKDST